ncbi:MAG: universal stress protein [Pseudomonadota bacterium]
MTYRRIFAPLIDRESAEPCLNLALPLAKTFGAEVDAVHLRQDPPIPTAVYHPFPYAYVPMDAREIEQVADDLCSDLRESFRRVCAAHAAPVFEYPYSETNDAEKVSSARSNDAPATPGFRAIWTEARGLIPEGLAARARVCDLTVLPRLKAPTTIFEDRVMEEIIFASGRPVLIGGEAPINLSGRVLFGWDGGREAARALAAAAPFLGQAADVRVVSFGDLKPGASGPEEAARYLSLHGAPARGEIVAPSKGRSAEESFLAYAKEMSADLIVIGAYSHSRLRTLVLGGFTKFLLRESDVPVLLGH